MHNYFSITVSSTLQSLSEIGNTPWRMVHFWPITLSACIHTENNSRLQSTSCFSNCFFTFVNGGIFTLAKTILALSLQVKLLSANHLYM